MADKASLQEAFPVLLELASRVVASLAQAFTLMAMVSLAQVPGSARATAPASVLVLALALALVLAPAWVPVWVPALALAPAWARA